jgi:hypothetical protein
MLTASKLAKFFAERDRELLKFLKQYAVGDDAPAPEPAPPKPEPIPKGETYQEMLQRKIRDDVRAGRAISMTALGKSIPRAKPPSRPSQQARRFNGFWHYW